MTRLVKLLPWLMGAGIAWGIGFIYNTNIDGKIGLLRGMYAKKTVLAAQKQQERRIILVGGSGAHYSVNSQLLEEKLNIPVFNFGLDGNLGFNVIFPTILPQIRSGDIVLLIPEYLMLLDEDGIGERSVFFEVATQQTGIGNIPPKQYAQDTFSLGISSLRSLVKTSVDVIAKGHIDNYYSDPITDWGDPTKTWERNSKWWSLKLKTPVTPHSIEAIRQFRQDLAAKNATLIIALPWIYGSTDQKTRENARKTGEELSKIAPTLYDSQSLNIKTNSDWFADTQYHLQPEARVRRADELVEQIKPYLKLNNEP